MDCQGLKCIWMSARLARCQFLIKLWPHINICQWGAQSTYKYAKFYGKLTNLYIKNVKNLNKLHGNYSTQANPKWKGGDCDGDGKNVCIIVHNLFACHLGVRISRSRCPTFRTRTPTLKPCLATPFEEEHPEILSCFSCAICQLPHRTFLIFPGAGKLLWNRKAIVAIHQTWGWRFQLQWICCN